MTHLPTKEILSLLTAWADRPDAPSDLREIFGASPEETTPLLVKIQKGDFSWVPSVEILPSAALDQALGAYSRETSAIYLSSDCPQNQITGVILEEIGHHIDALFNDQETPGDEGALFSAAVRGITLSDEEITAILNEDDSATLSLHGREIAIECQIPAQKIPTAPPSKDTIFSAVSTILPATSHGLVGTGSANITLTGNSGPATSSTSATVAKGATTISVTSTAGFAIGQKITGSGIPAGTTITAISGTILTLSAKTTAAIAKGAVLSSLLSWNYLQANSGNSTLIAASGTAADGPVTTMAGGSGNDWLLGGSGTNTEYFKGGSGNSTMVANNGLATLIGGTGNNSLVAGTSPTRTLGQSLVGGGGANTLLGGKGMDTLRSGSGTNSLISGSALNGSNTLIGGGSSSMLRSGAGNDSLDASISGNATLFGGTGKDALRRGTGAHLLISGSALNGSNTLYGGRGGSSSTLYAGAGNDYLAYDTLNGGGKLTLIGGVAGRSTLRGGTGTNSLYSGSSLNGGNSLFGGAGSNTLVAGLGKDTIIGGNGNNLLLITDVYTQNGKTLIGAAASVADAFAKNTVSLSSAHNTLGISSSAPVTVNDSLFSAIQAPSTLGTVAILSGISSNKILLGAKAEATGVQTLVSGQGADTLSVAGFKNRSALLDASRALRMASLVGGSLGGDTFFGSKGGYDTMIGSGGDDLIILQGSALTGNSFGIINGNAGTDTIVLPDPAILSGISFNGVSNIEILSLAGGNNSIGSLQGSGIQKIVGNTGSDTLSANVYGSVKAVTLSGSPTITLNVYPGTSPTMGFAIGQVVTGNGLADGTTITAVSTAPGTLTLTLSAPTTSLISQGGAIRGWLNNATLDGSAALGFPLTDDTLKAVKAFQDAASAITSLNYGTPNEYNKDTLAISSLQNDPSTFLHRKGDYLVSNGQNNLLIGGQGNDSLGKNLPDLYLLPLGISSRLKASSNFDDYSAFASDTISGNAPSDWLSNSPARYQHQVVDNTLISGAFASNTLRGGSGANLYLINNLPGATSPLPSIQNLTTLQSASTIQFTGNGVTLNDTALSSVSAKAAQKIITANGNNLIAIGQNAYLTGIQTIIGGAGSDTFITPADYIPSVYLDASRNGGISSLKSGSGNDTLLGGSNSSTLLGGDGNNSLRGGNGYNLIKSGVGTSTLDSGYGISTLQADGGTNRFVVRNRYTRILNRDLTNPITAFTPEVGVVDTYVNFDPIQGSPVSQFSPYYPDNSPSITKSPSFASSDLSSFYNLQYFNLLGGANYGVGNALDNTLTAVASGALILGMGGNNTIIASGAGSSLYGNSNANYASPDLYAYAPIDTRDQAFVDGVMGVAGNNSLVAGAFDSLGNISANGYSYLDGGSGYDNGLFDGSGSNTLIGLYDAAHGTGGNDTVVISHQADVVSLMGASNTAITSVDLYQAPNNVSNLIVNVTPQFANSGQVTFAGQRMTASYAAIAGATGGYTDTNSITGGNAPAVIVNNSAKIQTAYGTSAGTVYGTPEVAGANLPLTVGTFVPDLKNPGKEAVALSWTTPLDPDGNSLGRTMGFLVNYQILAGAAPLTLAADGLSGDTIVSVYDVTGINAGEKISGNGIMEGTTVVAVDKLLKKLTLSRGLTNNVNRGDSVTAYVASTPYLTYLNGTSQDLNNGTWENPRLTVDNLSTSFTDPYTGITYDSTNSTISYSFKVTAQETVLPAYTDATGNLIARPVSLLGGQGNDVLYGSLFNDTITGFSSRRPLLSNNPVDPADPGTIPTPASWSITSKLSGLFPVYLGGGLGGNDLIIAPVVNDGSGSDFTAYEYLNGVPIGVNYSGLCTLEGGQGSDTFVVSNGGQSISTLNGVVTTDAFDHIVKYGKENPDNLVYSAIPYLGLSDTMVDQGVFVNKAWAPFAYQYLGGNRLNNTLVGFQLGDTLLGGGGRDFLDASQGNNAGQTLGGGAGTLIGGTAYGLDSIAAALADYAAGQISSIYRDTDPVPVQPNGPGTSDNSQYWMVNGSYDPLRNSDTLIAGDTKDTLNGVNGEVLDGGAGKDSMVGGTGDDTLFVSSKLGNENNSNISSGDVVVGGGGNDWILYTGSDVYWSGLNVASNTQDGTTAIGQSATTSTLGYALSNKGDASGDTGQSISNIKLQDGDPVALWATGNATSSGNQHQSDILGIEEGSNNIVGNEFDNTLDGWGVGGTSGKNSGIDTLTGGTGLDVFVITGNGNADYMHSTKDQWVVQTKTVFVNGILSTIWDPVASTYTDTDYNLITDFNALDKLHGSTASQYWIGPTPRSLTNVGPHGAAATTTDFGLYQLFNDKPNLINDKPNLIAEVKTTGGFGLNAADLTAANYAFNPTVANGNPNNSYFGWADTTHAFYNLAGTNFAANNMI